MDWHKWKEDNIEWRGAVYTCLCQIVTSIFVSSRVVDISLKKKRGHVSQETGTRDFIKPSTSGDSVSFSHA